MRADDRAHEQVTHDRRHRQAPEHEHHGDCRSQEDQCYGQGFVHRSPEIYTSPVTNLLQPHALSDAEHFLDLAREVLDIEAQAVLAVKSRLGEAFLEAHRAMLQTKGRVVVTGMGKSGHIGCKIASTLASTGTPAFF